MNCCSAAAALRRLYGTFGWCRALQCHTVCFWRQRISICKQKVAILRQVNTKTTWRFRIKTNEYQSVIEGDRFNLFRYAKRGGNTGKYRNLNWGKHHLPTLGILLVEPDRKKTLNWSKKKRLLAKRMLYSSSSLTWKRPRGNRQFSHLFIGWKGPRDDKTQNTHVLNSRASLGTSGNKMADEHQGLQLFATSH